MATGLNKFWLLATFLLIIIIILNGLIIELRRSPGRPVEISIPQSRIFSGEIYVDGAVINPGIYPITSTDNIETVLQATGGTISSADLSRVHLYIPRSGESQKSQKVDINRADAWLLSALPDIGNVRAQAIVGYREQNGPFRNIEEITQVPGIGRSTFEKIKDLITLVD